MNDLTQAISRLRALSPQLNAAVIEADRVVTLVERFLVNECGLGVEAEVPLHFNDKGKAVTLLRYASCNGAFRIAVTHTDGSTHFVTRPWSQCDRNQRLISFAALPKLLLAILKAVEQQIASTTNTAGTVGQIISALGQSALMGDGNGEPSVHSDDLTLMVSPQDGGSIVNDPLTEMMMSSPPPPPPASARQTGSHRVAK